MIAAVLALGLAVARAAPAPQPPAERIAEITVHGNVLTPDDEIRRLAGLEPGMPVGPSTVEDAAARLKASKKFQSVDVRKRFASIADPTAIAIVIVVDEGAVHVEQDGNGGSPRVARNRLPGVMLLPILNATDGYGVTYGVRFALPNKIGPDSRIAFPLSWGGERQAAIELDKLLPTGRLTRLTGGAGLSRRVNPYYEVPDTRARLWARAEHEFVTHLRAGVSEAWQRVSFGGGSDSLLRSGVDVTLDTRLDPMLARNAVYARASLEHVAFGSRPAATLLSGDMRGYLGFIGQSVLVARVLHEGADAPLPPYLKRPFGGIGTVRGFRAGERVGDNAFAASLELLVPLTSPLKIARLGVSGFVDAGAASDYGERLHDQPLQRGVGGSVWMTATFIRLSVAVAHGIGASTRVHVGGTVSF
jgi:outer membrane protein assembly factor BamA